MSKIKGICLILCTLSLMIMAITLILRKPNTYDVNNDGKVNAVDYVLIKTYIMNKWIWKKNKSIV